MNNLFLTILSLSIIGSIAIVFVILLNKIFRKNYSRRWIYIIWGVIAVRLIVPVQINVIDITDLFKTDGAITSSSIQSPAVDYNKNVTQQNSNESVKNVNNKTDMTNHNTSSTTSKVLTQNTIHKNQGITISTFISSHVLDFISIVWLMGTILFLLYHSLVYLSFRVKIRRWSIFIKDHAILDEVYNLCSEMKIKGSIKVLSCNQVSSPMLLGFIKPCIVLPSKEFTREQYHFILKHELIHYKNHDLFYKLILLCTTALHWFNPLVHYMVYLANNDIELYCDEKLVSKNNISYRENYSNMMIYIMAGVMKNNNILLSTGFGNEKKQLKSRFYQIMNSKPTKKGTCFIIGLVSFILVVSNLIASFVPAKISGAEVTNNSSNSITYNPSLAPEHLKKTKNILVVGIDETKKEGNANADSILMVSIIPDKKKIVLVSFLRDMYLQIPKHGYNKLSHSYQIGGSDLMKSTIETNFGLKIDHIVTVNMDAFENIIDYNGGVNIKLSKQEAEYLNNTNYISEKKNRNVKAGKQKLNGNQALGYVRVRKVPTLQGEDGDLGRTSRLRTLVSSVIKESSKKNVDVLAKEFMYILPNIVTDINAQQLLSYLKAVLLDGMNVDTVSIPANKTYTETMKNQMYVLDIDLDKNKKLLQQIYQ